MLDEELQHVEALVDSWKHLASAWCHPRALLLMPWQKQSCGYQQSHLCSSAQDSQLAWAQTPHRCAGESIARWKLPPLKEKGWRRHTGSGGSEPASTRPQNIFSPEFWKQEGPQGFPQIFSVSKKIHFSRHSNYECNMLRGQEKFCDVAVHSGAASYSWGDTNKGTTNMAEEKAVAVFWQLWHKCKVNNDKY